METYYAVVWTFCVKFPRLYNCQTSITLQFLPTMSWKALSHNPRAKIGKNDVIAKYFLKYFIFRPKIVSIYESLAYHLHKIGQTVYVVLPNKARKFCEAEGIKPHSCWCQHLPSQRLSVLPLWLPVSIPYFFWFHFSITAAKIRISERNFKFLEQQMQRMLAFFFAESRQNSTKNQIFI